MLSLCFNSVGKLAAIISLKDMRLITKVSNGPLEEIYSGIAALLQVGMNETFSGGFINDCVLVELLWNSSTVTDRGDIFDIHLPFAPQCCWGIIGLWFIRLFDVLRFATAQPAAESV